METVAVSSAMVPARLSTHETSIGVVCAMRELRRFAPVADMGGVCSLTKEALS